MDTLITISDVSYNYGDITALNNINVSVNKNELFGLIGPDGSGKTTLFRMLATLLIPQKGQILYEDIDIVPDYKAIRKIIGYMPGKFSLYQDLTVMENLEFFASVFNTSINENYYLIKDIYKMLEPFKDRKAGKLSGGMKQKLALSCALIHKPELLILDEPTTGVDAVSRREFWDMLSNLKNMGITIVVSTPYMDEAKRCDRVALIKDGIIMKIDTPELIEKSFEYLLYAVHCNNNFRLLNMLRSATKIINAYSFGQDLHIVVKQEDDLVRIINSFNTLDLGVINYKRVKPNIEDCFIQQMMKNN